MLFLFIQMFLFLKHFLFLCIENLYFFQYANYEKGEKSNNKDL